MSFTRGQIFNAERYKQAKLIDFSGLCGAFPLPSITPSDIDFIVERKSRFLIGEVKAQGTDIPTGQQILLDALLHGLSGSWVFEAEHDCPVGGTIQMADCSVVRCRSIIRNNLYDKRYERGTMSVLALCEKWSNTFIAS